LEILTWLLAIRHNQGVIGNDSLVKKFLLFPMDFSSLPETDALSSSSIINKSRFNLILEENHPSFVLRRTVLNQNDPEISAAATASLTSIPPRHSLESIIWSDVSKEILGMSEDARFSHSFKVRGPSYLNDKKKMDGGPAIAKFCLMELFSLPKDMEKVDHIALRPQVKKRIDYLTSLEENPFILIIHIQIPGDPPVATVFYFAIPSYFHHDLETSSTLKKSKALFEKFANLPKKTTSSSVKSSSHHYSGNDSNSFEGNGKPSPLSASEPQVEKGDFFSYVSSCCFYFLLIVTYSCDFIVPFLSFLYSIIPRFFFFVVMWFGLI
jgi:hypothetical protein